jgi:hypothetical protein
LFFLCPNFLPFCIIVIVLCHSCDSLLGPFLRTEQGTTRVSATHRHDATIQRREERVQP